MSAIPLHLIYASLAHEAIARKLGRIANSAHVDLKSTVEHVDLQFVDADAATEYVYSIETEYVATIQSTERTEHQFSIDVRICGCHYSAAVFICEGGGHRWSGEVTEFQQDVPHRSFRLNTLPAAW